MTLRGSTLTFAVTFTVETCAAAGCGLSFAMTDEFIARKRRNPGPGPEGTFYCPNGHPQHYQNKSDAQRAREAEEEANRQRGLRRIAEEDAANARTAAKRETTRRKNVEKRVAAGICPKCRRRFADLADHYVTKHGGAPEEIARVIAERKPTACHPPR
jgi:hypothetical protein